MLTARTAHTERWPKMDENEGRAGPNRSLRFVVKCNAVLDAGPEKTRKTTPAKDKTTGRPNATAKEAPRAKLTDRRILASDGATNQKGPACF